MLWELHREVVWFQLGECNLANLSLIPKSFHSRCQPAMPVECMKSNLNTDPLENRNPWNRGYIGSFKDGGVMYLGLAAGEACTEQHALALPHG